MPVCEAASSVAFGEYNEMVLNSKMPGVLNLAHFKVSIFQKSVTQPIYDKSGSVLNILHMEIIKTESMNTMSYF